MNNKTSMPDMNSNKPHKNNNYGPFNNNKNRKKGKFDKKTININHYHLGNKNNYGPNAKPNVDCSNDNIPSLEHIIDKEQLAKDIIDRFSLNKPMGNNPLDSSRNTPMIIGRSNNGSPINFIPGIPQTLHIIQTTEKINPLSEKINPLPETNDDEIFEEILLDNEVEDITDLIKISEKYPIKPNVKYSIDLVKLNKIIPYLNELNNMIGMDTIKKGLTRQLMYFLQGFEFKHMLHTIIEGPPGVGKTCLGKILGQIYLELGCINTDNNPNVSDDEDGQFNFKKLFSNILKIDKPEQNKKFKFKIAKRSDLVGQYVGHTAVKTQKVINDSFGGVLFIDEAYSLGGDDVFSKECINTLNQNLSENGDKFVCIIAGYSDALESNFFSQNSGLQRRFPFRYRIEKYNSEELTKILMTKLNSEKFTISSEFNNLTNFIEDNKECFPNFGGDIETYFFQLKIMHSTRVFGKSIKLRNILIKDDFINAIGEIKNNKKKDEVKPDFYT
jgi:SpoVK/Ycf46/Vps4 family AAA+-type ATPase